MAELTLFHIPESQWFDKNAIVYGTRREHGPSDDEYSPQSPWFTALHGGCNYYNGEEALPGAFDPTAQLNKITLPNPLLTNEDRKPNSYGWCVGDIGICKQDGSICKKGALIQLKRDDDSDCPYWVQIYGPKTTFSDGTFSVYYSHIQHIDLPDHLLASEEKPSMTIRNPFQEGDVVVLNGFKANGDEHRFGTVSEIVKWLEEGTLLDVVSARDNGLVRVTDSTDTFSLDASELRMATDRELETRSKLPTFEVGQLIKMNGKVGMVKRAEVDSDGDLRVALVTGGEQYFRVAKDNAGTFTTLGRIMPDGDFRPAEAPSTEISQDPRTWKPGDKIRCGSDQSSYLTKGRVYEIEDIDHAGGYMTIKCEDDGTSGRRGFHDYGWVKVA